MSNKNNNTYTLTMQAINNNKIKKRYRKMLREVRGLSYIGGTTEQARDTFWKKFPKISAAVDSVANAYNINVGALRNRLENEGFVDTVIEDNNRAYFEPEYYDKYPEDSILNSRSPVYLDDGFQKFGLDYTYGLIQEGKIKPINERYRTAPTDYNELGVQVPAAHGLTNLDNIGLTAATLEYTRRLAKQNHSGIKGKHLDEASVAYYNLSPASAKRMVNSGNLDSRYKIK